MSMFVSSKMGMPADGSVFQHNPNPHVPFNPTSKFSSLVSAFDDVVHAIMPGTESLQQRRNVLEFVKGVVEGSCDAQVHSFGSFPLKTYLPDGDIDVSLFFKSQYDRWHTDIHHALEKSSRKRTRSREDDAKKEGESKEMEGDAMEAEEKRGGQEEEEEKKRGEEVGDGSSKETTQAQPNSESNEGEVSLAVSNIQVIHAEVKVVKCFVDDIPVDISSNQIGGLYTNRFLELVDQLVGKHHLLKRSVILLKAWAYYESRILGSHAGLLASYALEVLVLYILNLYHTHLQTPFEVLFKFFDVFSTFDWDNYGVTLRGPFDVASLPRLDTHAPVQQTDMLLSEDFIASCVVPTADLSAVVNRVVPHFNRRSMNIVDPLNPNNNLGRSINRANYLRIRKACQKGAQEIMRLVARATSPHDELTKQDAFEFFRTLCKRHPDLFKYVKRGEKERENGYAVLSTDVE
eukprot:CAMPEP_0113891222 /NCGR_PEP_ID=MMETSP0780_2-20120614/14628_1 /TAXON_ID=652834 /ORGANISM="Palpitomonas bilix" /LENGTH=460 /DNA_ID=CAMNT_0000880799 /DNA_START=211 /DNA_END=1590 /DNA_ORIENTATION=- /assembly_acc=CAM_ASM_000599